VQKIGSGRLRARVHLVISSNPHSAGLEFASNSGIPTVVAQHRRSAHPAAFQEAVFGPCRELGIQLVVMGGFLRHVLIPADFENRVMNIHPALIPAFCGKGFYGLRVHQAVLDYGVKISGCTVHFVDNEYDHGPIILQRTVTVEDDDTPESLQRRVFEQECLAYPEAIQLYADRRLFVADRRVRVARS
jgi:phosphoribosylglycinamide formyltransferase-1